MKKIKEARATKNGIFFNSNTMPDLGVETYLNEEGEIESRIIPEVLLDTISSDNEKIKIWKVIIFDLILIITSIVVCKNYWITLATIFCSTSISYDVFKLVKDVYNYKFGNQKDLSRFHGAEHMAASAYYKLQRIPSLEEIKNFSRCNNKCGSRIRIYKILGVILISLNMAFVVEKHPTEYIILILLIPFILFILNKIGFLKPFQLLITSKPTDKELEVAIEGLKQFEIMENNFENHGMCIIDDLVIFPFIFIK